VHKYVGLDEDLGGTFFRSCWKGAGFFRSGTSCLLFSGPPKRSLGMAWQRSSWVTVLWSFNRLIFPSRVTNVTLISKTFFELDALHLVILRSPPKTQDSKIKKIKNIIIHFFIILLLFICFNE
jgi:hypothetical protein